jgi:hypothetical protein
MKLPSNATGRRVSPEEVRLVLDLSRPMTAREWAGHFGVHLRTIEAWRSQGMVLDRGAGPEGVAWSRLRLDATEVLWQHLRVLQGI